MDREILMALHEMENRQFKTIKEAMQEYSKEELLDIWLRYEGIQGYTNKILSVLNLIDQIETDL